MSDCHSIEPNEAQAGGHPHELVARLYREIGVSAVAAALEALNFADPIDDAPQGDASWEAMGDEIAA